ncbi:MAG TPA: hypothetical protein VK821_11850 [Dehalococcoidia bacterium]|nr:hypothetical protein [Dehalococcoidia bacterium]
MTDGRSGSASSGLLPGFLIALCTFPSLTTVGARVLAQSSSTIQVMSGVGDGPYLADASGMTLYTFSIDTPKSGASACIGACAIPRPPALAPRPSLTAAPPADTNKLERLTRQDGGPQLI